MLIVKNLQGNTEALADVSQAEILEQVSGNYMLSLVVPNSEGNRHSYNLVSEESILETEDGQEFRIKAIDSNRIRKAVTAQHIFFDLIDKYVYDIVGGTKTIEECLTHVLSGTGWTFTIEGTFTPKLIFNVGESNVVALLTDIMSTFDAEYKIAPGKHIEIHQQIGSDTDYQFRYKYNTKTIKHTVDTSNLSTVIKGYGSEGLVVEYRSPNESVYGERHAEPIRDDRYTIAESLTERLIQELKDVPNVVIEVEGIELDFTAELGDRVWLIYEPMGIEFQTRVMEKKVLPFKKSKSLITLSNIKQTTANQFSNIRRDVSLANQGVKETRSRIEQTDERITLEVEALGSSIAQLELENDSITLSVSSLDQELATAQSELTVQAGLISSKVSSTDYNGNTVVSMINQSDTTIDISAQKINLVGAVNVLSDISGNLGTVTAGILIGTEWRSPNGVTPFQVFVSSNTYPSMEVYDSNITGKGQFYANGHVNGDDDILTTRAWVMANAGTAKFG